MTDPAQIRANPSTAFINKKSISLTIEILLTAYPLFNSIIIVIQCKNFINQFIFLTSLKLPSQIKRSHTSRNLALI